MFQSTPNLILSFLNLHLMVGLPLRIYTCCSLSTEFKLWWCGSTQIWQRKNSTGGVNSVQRSNIYLNSCQFLPTQFDGKQHLFALLYCCEQTILNINMPSIWACLVFYITHSNAIYWKLIYQHVLVNLDNKFICARWYYAIEICN